MDCVENSSPSEWSSCSYASCSGRRRLANEALVLFAVLSCEEATPALSWASLAEVFSCSICSSQARTVANDAVELAALFSCEEELPALDSASLAEVYSCSLRSSQARTAANDASELAALLTREGELPPPFLLSPVEVRWLWPRVGGSGSGSGTEARSMCLQASLLALLWWSDENRVILQSTNQLLVPIMHDSHHVVRLFVHIGQHEIVDKFDNANRLRDAWLLRLFHSI